MRRRMGKCSQHFCTEDFGRRWRKGEETGGEEAPRSTNPIPASSAPPNPTRTQPRLSKHSYLCEFLGFFKKTGITSLSILIVDFCQKNWACQSLPSFPGELVGREILLHKAPQEECKHFPDLSAHSLNVLALKLFPETDVSGVFSTNIFIKKK